MEAEYQIAHLRFSFFCYGKEFLWSWKIDGNPFADTEFGQLECVEVNGKLYFPASECAKVLGYHNPRKAIIDHCDEPIKLTVPHPQSPLKTIVKNYISEGDLYSLIFNSRLPIGRQFRAWICDEVLPTIRKYGFYVTPKVLAECDGNPEKLKRKLMEIQCYQFWNYCLDHPDKAADLISKFYEKAMKEDDIIDAEFCDEVSNETSRLIECSAVSNELRTARNAEISPVWACRFSAVSLPHLCWLKPIHAECVRRPRRLTVISDERMKVR